eukprot:TRINITY_DN21379_c0_g4_i1.p1 TRINITY_DN21379_c0_g4~~TRINITY_DN21379_c0_g4_i1.p1  ORF type:complete len:1177 (+),score=225.41 TRINITY_DN21379_c0_g4_i1:58-3531(+)
MAGQAAAAARSPIPGQDAPAAAPAPAAAREPSRSSVMATSSSPAVRNSRYIQALAKVCRPMANRPLIWCSAVLLVVLLIVGIALGTVPFVVEPDFSSLTKSDVKASLYYDVYQAANKMSRDGDGDSSSRRLSPRYVDRDVLLVYLLEGRAIEGAVLNSAVLRAIAQFERSLTELDAWKKLCSNSSAPAMCSPGVSFATLAMATEVYAGTATVPSQLQLDGRSWGPISNEAAYAVAKKYGHAKFVFPDSFSGLASTELSSLRSAFRFSTTLDDAAWDRFLIDSVWPQLRVGLPVSDTGAGVTDPPRLRILYGASRLEDIEVIEALKSDLGLALASLVFVLLYLLFHTRSAPLTIVGLLAAVLAVPLAYLLLALGGDTTLNFSLFLAVFLTIGFGCDVLLLYTDFWNASATRCGTYAERLAYTYARGGVAALASTFTTSLSFLANLASVLQSLRRFGFFMALCVILIWILISFIYVPFLVFDDVNLRRWHLRLPRRKPVPDAPAAPAEEAKQGRGMQRYIFASWSSHLQKRRQLYSVVPTLMIFICGIVGLANLNLDYTDVTLFHPGHPRHRMEAAEQDFPAPGAGLWADVRAIPANEPVCPLTGRPMDCSFSMCDMDTSRGGTPTVSKTTSCKCRRTSRAGSCRNQSLSTSLMVVGAPQRLTAGTASAGIKDFAALNAGAEAAAGGAAQVAAVAANGAPLLLRDWGTGAVEEQRVDAFEVTQEQASTSTACGWDVECWCGSSTCRYPSGAAASNLIVPGVASDGSRRLASGKLIQVSVLFGITVDASTFLIHPMRIDSRWSFAPGFRIDDPDAQRAVWRFCQGLGSEANKHLRIKSHDCWIEKLKDCMTSRNKLFPVTSSRFYSALETCSDGLTSTWRLNKKVVAIRVGVELDVATSVSSAEKRALAEAWDAHMAAWNAQSPVTAGSAFQTSEEWAREESGRQLTASMSTTVIVLFVLALVAVIIFTRSIALSFLVVYALGLVVLALFFVFVTLMQWSLGMLEGIAMIYFVGYALTYSLHVAHVYAHDLEDEPQPKETRRSQRVRHSLTQVGGAIWGSGATTAGASFFLVFCQLQVFQKIGTMCLVVTLLSVFVALCPLPAFLHLCGIQEPGFCRRKAAPAQPPGVPGMTPSAARPRDVSGEMQQQGELEGMRTTSMF